MKYNQPKQIIFSVLIGIVLISCRTIQMAQPTSTTRSTLLPISTSIPVTLEPSATSTSNDAPTINPTEVPTITPATGNDIGSTWIRPEDGMTMVYVPAGSFNMGSYTGKKDQQPVNSVSLAAYWIDQTEVTNGKYALCVNANACQAPSKSNSYYILDYFHNPQFADYPVIYVDWNKAVAYCSWAGARLPSEAEWEKAALGTDGRLYPWGNTLDSTLANYNQYVGDTTEVGSYPTGISPYGALDMAGNVWEWVNDWYNVYPGGDASVSSDFGQTFRVARGGSWYYDEGDLHSAYRYANLPSDSSYNLGFRCVRDPLP
jgi:formylglycine-generating enzyme required for sulfatase activity